MMALTMRYLKLSSVRYELAHEFIERRRSQWLGNAIRHDFAQLPGFLSHIADSQFYMTAVKQVSYRNPLGLS